MIENNLDGSNPNVIPDFQIRGTASMPSTNELTSSFVGSPNMPTFIMDGFEVTAEKVSALIYILNLLSIGSEYDNSSLRQ